MGPEQDGFDLMSKGKGQGIPDLGVAEAGTLEREEWRLQTQVCLVSMGDFWGLQWRQLQKLREARLWILVSPEFLTQVLKCYGCILVSSYPELLRIKCQPVIQDFVRYSA